jgi:hypothetical protein
MAIVLWLCGVFALVCAVWFWVSYRRAPRPWTMTTAIVASLATVFLVWAALIQ